VEQGGGFEEVAFGGEREPIGYAVREGAALDAEGFRALDAAGGLFAGGLFVKHTVDLQKVGDSFHG
jgi:hypothetical protein